MLSSAGVRHEGEDTLPPRAATRSARSRALCTCGRLGGGTPARLDFTSELNPSYRHARVASRLHSEALPRSSNGNGRCSPYVWSVTPGAFPPGLSLHSTSGQIGGTPKQGGQFSATITVKDSSGASASKTFNLQVFEQPTDKYGGLVNAGEPDGPVFRTAAGNTMWQQHAYWIIQVRAGVAGIKARIGNHTFRATEMAAYLRDSAKLEIAQHIADDESPRTTKLYDRTGDEITLDEVERIAI